MNPISQFQEETKRRIEEQDKNDSLKKAAKELMTESVRSNYSYNFTWMGRPIIQYPQDMIAMQELIWQIKPELIIETGVAHGGSLIYYASLLELIGKGEVIGVDIDIRPHNRIEIERHPMFSRIKMIEGSSTSDVVLNELKKLTERKSPVLIVLDSNHTHEHVLQELKLYSSLVTAGSYLVVFDTVVEELPETFFSDRPWAKGNNPKTAVHEFLKTNHDFEIDKSIQKKLLITVAPDGYLKKIK
ncbi:MAG: cephalosporin hydroxylase family protein [Bacteroidia bacterium]|nr:cephalosporin hydroxylase family protein [Bacteroidia bacterium]